VELVEDVESLPVTFRTCKSSRGVDLVHLKSRRDFSKLSRHRLFKITNDPLLRLRLPLIAFAVIINCSSVPHRQVSSSSCAGQSQSQSQSQSPTPGANLPATVPRRLGRAKADTSETALQHNLAFGRLIATLPGLLAVFPRCTKPQNPVRQ
jgi:hypothetical protein